MYQLVLIRHGQSKWNLENRFTGWEDVDLSDQGIKEARAAGQLLRAEGYEFDLAFTSFLKRAIRTLWILLDELDQMWIPVERAWELNERHYGNLQGLNKSETAEKYGEKQVHVWRRSYGTLPPLMDESDERHPKKSRRYQSLSQVPSAESLETTLARVVPYWEKKISPQIKSGKRILIAAHGNSLRALVKHLDQVSNDEITGLNIPTGIPLVYELDQELHPIRHSYLGDQEKLKKEMEAIANQGKR